MVLRLEFCQAPSVQNMRVWWGFFQIFQAFHLFGLTSNPEEQAKSLKHVTGQHYFHFFSFANLETSWKFHENPSALPDQSNNLASGKCRQQVRFLALWKITHHIMSLHREMIYWYNTDIHVHKCPYSKLPALPTQMNAKDLAESLKLALQASCSEAIVALRNKASGQSLFSPANAIWYCWWQKLIGSFSHYLQGLYIPGGAGFQPSTVA